MSLTSSEASLLIGLTSGSIFAEDIKAITDRQFFEAITPLILSNNEFHTFEIVESIASHYLANRYNLETILSFYVKNVRSAYSIRNTAGGLSKLEARQALYKLAPKISAESYIGMEDVIPYSDAVELAKTNIGLALAFLQSRGYQEDVVNYLWSAFEANPFNFSDTAKDTLARFVPDEDRMIRCFLISPSVVDNANFTARVAKQYLARAASDEAMFQARLYHFREKGIFPELTESF
jgi:hypothetical protein